MYRMVHHNPEGEKDESAGCNSLVFARFGHLDCGYAALRQSGSSHTRDHESALLEGLRSVADHFSGAVYRDSALEAHRSAALDLGNASPRDSRNDRRSCGAFQPVNIHAQNTGYVGRKIRSISFRHLCARSGSRGSRHVEGHTLSRPQPGERLLGMEFSRQNVWVESPVTHAL